MLSEPTVFVVDDDTAMCQSIRWLLESVGLAAETYTSVDQFLARFDPTRPGCLIVDIRMPVRSGLDLQAELVVRQATLPIIVISGYADVPVAVRALKAGAIDFFEKPFSDQLLLDRVRQAIDIDARARSAATARADVVARLATLTRRERDVLDRVAEGKTNKLIAAELGIGMKTVEVHRAHVMEKMGVDSVASLIRALLSADDDGGIPTSKYRKVPD